MSKRTLTLGVGHVSVSKAEVTQQQRLVLVLERLTAMAKADEDFAEFFSHDIEPVLDDIHNQDGFGTEGQSDPRGDFRNGAWRIDYVEGLD
jgi:hypothetical protein